MPQSTNRKIDLEDSNLLDISNGLHLYVVKIVFVHLINVDLQRFKDGWDCHPIRTASNCTPNQLWLLGKIDYQPGNGDFDVDNSYRVDFDGPVTLPSGTGRRTPYYVKLTLRIQTALVLISMLKC